MPWGKPVELQKGQVIRRSLRKTLLKIGFALVAGCGGIGITAVSVSGAFEAWRQNPTYLPLILLALAIFALIGVALAALGAVLVGVFVLALYHNERLIVGSTCLQCIVGQATANLQVPFDNIQRLAWATKLNPDGTELAFIGIDLLDPRRADTIIHGADRKANRHNHGFDVVLFDDYEAPLKKLFKRLKDCCGTDEPRAATERSAD
jgi:hypothetical protein